MTRLPFAILLGILLVCILTCCSPEEYEEEDTGPSAAEIARKKRISFQARAKSAYDKAVTEHNRILNESEDLDAAINALDKFPFEFRKTVYWTSNIPAMKSKLERRKDVSIVFEKVRTEVQKLEEQGKYKEALWKINELDADYGDVLGKYRSWLQSKERQLGSQIKAQRNNK